MSGRFGKHNFNTLAHGSKNTLCGTEGTAKANLAVLLDANKAVDAVRTAALYLGTSGSETALTATGAELNVLDAAVANVVFTVGEETANVINVAMQFNDANGTAMAVKSSIPIYLTSDAAGLDFETSGVDSWAIGTDGSFLADGGDSVISGRIISEADGDADLNLTHAGEDVFYLNAVLPNGKTVVSGAITFDATT